MATTNQADLQTHSKRLVRGISLRQKLAILRQLEAGVPRKEICENLSCCQSTISRVLVAKDEIMLSVEQDKNQNRKSAGMVTYKDIDDKLSKWALEMKNTNQVITANSAKHKAEEIARQMGEEDFVPSAGWLYKWKERENVQFFKKPKVADYQLGAAVGGKEEILKGLLERQADSRLEYIHKCQKMGAFENNGNDVLPGKANDNDIQQNCRNMVEISRILHQNFLLNNNYAETLAKQEAVTRSLGFECPRMLPVNNCDKNPLESQAKANCNVPPVFGSLIKDSAVASSRPVSTVRKTVPKKVLYSYNPVYVLTSSGRYRKEKTFLTLLQKLKILERLKNGEKRTDLINEYRLSQSAMSQIIADKKKITRMAAIGQNLQMKRIRGGIFKAGESELNAWVLEKMNNGETLTRTQVKKRAKEIADRMNIEFKASTGWLEKWKARMNMDFNEQQLLIRKKPQYGNNSDVLDSSNTAQSSESVSYSEENEVDAEADADADAIAEDDDDDDDGYDDDDDEVDVMDLSERLNVRNSIEENGNCNMDCSQEHSEDTKASSDSPAQYYPEVAAAAVVNEQQCENEDIKPLNENPPPALPAEEPVSDADMEEDESLHKQIITWLNKYNIAPTAATELLTVLHPVISENPAAPHQTRLTITTKPAPRSKGRAYVQHTYS